ncbi:DUF2568 domain-containing protein [Streptacidiphilus anmyonensis]|uniref:DUF2568 domain-containing protein n=1 Tax=Streptacidiphilus anmyonensis TaxID=405782 RepID=UPI0005A87C2E|nr:DUF2568 domain-containing protein [Streptacidiphilus anmyonensis]
MSPGAALAGVSATLGFLLELAVYVAAGYWGFTRRPPRLPARRARSARRARRARPARLALAARLVSALAVVALMAGVWSLFGAPSALHPVHGAGRAVLELGWFGAGAAALVATGRRRAALWFAAAWAVATVLELTVS